MYLWRSRHGIYYYRRNGMKKSLHTRKKREAVQQLSEIITGERERCPVEEGRKQITIQHAGAEICINGETMDKELALAQAIANTKITTKRIKDVLNLFCQEKISDGSWTEKTAAENRSYPARKPRVG